VGVYDGHGGPEAARSVNECLYNFFQKNVTEQGGMSTDVLCKSFKEAEDRFFEIVHKAWPTKPQLAAVGSCCLVGVVCSSKLYIANVGDSRAVLGSFSRDTGSVVARQISEEHNASFESVRNELYAKHEDDPQIVVLKHGVWRVKGLIQVSRSIGDFYLKNAEFNRAPLIARFRLPEPLKRPVMSAEPACNVISLSPQDEFVIFASDGLWEHLSNKEAVDIVYSHPRAGIARRLVKAALQEAAKKREMRYSDLKGIERGIRRHFHDDITVVVVYLDPKLASRVSTPSSHTSAKCPVDMPRGDRPRG
jgi:pyruvate dehydrogenase phosphatase